MAFNLQTFRTRTLSAIVFALIMLVGLLWNQWSFLILFSVIHFGCWIEYQRLVEQIDPEYKKVTSFHRYGIMLAGWCILLYFTNGSYNLFGLRVHEMGWWMGLLFIFILPITEILFTQNIQLKSIGHSAFGLIYISLSLGLLMNLYGFTNQFPLAGENANHAVFIPAVIIASIWINDTMAYIIGSLIGKHTLSIVSPKKTWEGTIGGIILSMAVVGLIAYYGFHFGRSTYHLVIIAAITAIAGTFGDLLESKLKRKAGVKDSGNLMPGHGGFLDRFDSLLGAVPFVWIYIKIVAF